MADEKQVDQVETPESEETEAEDTAQVEEKSKDSALEKVAGKMLSGKSRDTGTGRFTSTKRPEDDADPTSEAEQPEEQDDSPTQKVVKETVKPDTAVLSKRAIETAKQFGLDPGKLADMSTEEILEAGGVGYNRKMSEVGHWQQELKELRAASKKAEPTETDDSAKDKTRFTDEDFDSTGDDGIVGKLNSVIDRLETRLDELETGNQNRADAEVADKADRYFDDLDKEMFPDFGTGKSLALGDESPELAARTKVIEDATILQDAYAMRGKPITFEEALDWTVQIEFADAVKAADRRKQTKKVKVRRDQAGNPPTSRKGKATGATTHQQKMDKIRESGEEGGIW